MKKEKKAVNKNAYRTQPLRDNNPFIAWGDRVRNYGFTLIELLVVVLIIGILASVALPQYQKTVERSKSVQALSLIRTIAAAQQTYFMANGSYARTFDALDIDIPWTGNIRWIESSGSFTSSSSRGFSNVEWTVQFFHEGSGDGIAIGRVSGPYAGAGFLYMLASGYYPVNKVLCHEGFGGSLDFAQGNGDYCQKIIHAKEKSGSNTWIL